ncbi:MAG: flagellar hook-associated protein FlgL [Desulfitobacteriia bacterium]|jgi:flagellar hook-associated protein 3 FlgL
MRVTNNMLTQNLLKNLEAANNRMDLIQNRLATGQAITKPSDDPVRIEIALRFKSTISAMEQWKTNASEALAIMETTESILGNITAIIQRVRELAVKGVSGDNSANDRCHIAEEIDQLNEQLQVLANSQFGTRYIFSGTLVDTPPIAEIGDWAAWAGNEKPVEFEVGANVTIPVSISGIDLFGIGTGESLFDTLKNLGSHLRNEESLPVNESLEKINESLEKIDEHLDNVLAHRSELGAKTNRMYVIHEQLDITTINLKTSLSDLQDADMAENIMEFKSIQNVFRAALSVGAQIIQPSLVDFIR